MSARVHDRMKKQRKIVESVRNLVYNLLIKGRGKRRGGGDSSHPVITRLTRAGGKTPCVVAVVNGIPLGILRLPNRKMIRLVIRLGTRDVWCGAHRDAFRERCIVTARAMLHHFCHHYVDYPNRALLTEAHVHTEVGGLPLSSPFSSRHTSKRLALHVPLTSRYIKINHIILPLLIGISRPKTSIVDDDNYGFRIHRWLINTNDIRRDDRSDLYNDFRESKTPLTTQEVIQLHQTIKLAMIIESRVVQLY